MTQTDKFTLSAGPRAARAALQWRLLVLWAALLVLPTLILALPVWQTLGASLDHSVYAASLAQQLDLEAVTDLVGSLGRNGAALSNAGLVALVLTLALSPLLSGMVVSAARAEQPPGFRALMAGALHEYGRMLRMLVWAVLPLGLAIAIAAGVTEAAGKYGEKAILESDAQAAGLAALVLAGLLVALADATLDAGRATMAIDRRRRSAVKAWWAGCKLLMRRPFATFGIYLGFTVLGLLAAAVLAVARINVPPAQVAGFIGALVLTQLVVLVLAWMRSARLFAMIELARASRG